MVDARHVIMVGLEALGCCVVWLVGGGDGGWLVTLRVFHLPWCTQHVSFYIGLVAVPQFRKKNGKVCFKCWRWR